MNTNQPVFNEIGVIALVPDRWGPQWQARHQIAKRLARYFHVAWVDHPFTRQEILLHLFHDYRAQSQSPLPANLYLYQPGPWVPQLGRPAWLGRWTSKQRLRHARQLLLARGCSKIVLYLWRPEFAEALSQVPHRLSCYHIDDEYSFSAVEKALDPAEIKLMRSVDQVFIHSPALMAKKGGFNPNTELVPNGVDYQSYASAAPEPAELAVIPHPRIGYVGTLKSMLDWPLLLELSAQHPEWAFVFVGNVAAHAELPQVLSALAQRRNVHLLGARPAQSLPAYVQHCDVCIMPYRLNDYTKYIYPLKLHEYLATGRPVVGARIPSIEAFRSMVLLAGSPEEWSSAIERALSPVENTSACCEARRRMARMHDWDFLVEKIAAIVAGRLGYSLLPSQQVGNQTFNQQTCFDPVLTGKARVRTQ
jgi:glycosyltransferase involved in cell wall biosynthesis